jgi:hypothetical protein
MTFQRAVMTSMSRRTALRLIGAAPAAAAMAWTPAEARQAHERADAAQAQAARQAVPIKPYTSNPDPGLSQAIAFFSSFRDLTASGFWSTKMGVADLQYQGNAFVSEWKGCPGASLKKLGVSYDDWRSLFDGTSLNDWRGARQPRLDRARQGEQVRRLAKLWSRDARPSGDARRPRGSAGVQDHPHSRASLRTLVPRRAAVHYAADATDDSRPEAQRNGDLIISAPGRAIRSLFTPVGFVIVAGSIRAAARSPMRRR